jgi:ferredoxin
MILLLTSKSKRKWVKVSVRPAGEEPMKTLKVVVDHELCDANALCVEAAPEVFQLDDDDELHLLQEYPAESLRKKVEKAVRLCPKGALRLEQVPNDSVGDYSTTTR